MMKNLFAFLVLVLISGSVLAQSEKKEEKTKPSKTEKAVTKAADKTERAVTKAADKTEKAVIKAADAVEK
jgi:Na+-transporting methylmalonyl-CoA/oxaloacetate decarboxylase gamma subunit